MTPYSALLHTSLYFISHFTISLLLDYNVFTAIQLFFRSSILAEFASISLFTDEPELLQARAICSGRKYSIPSELVSHETFGKGFEKHQTTTIFSSCRCSTMNVWSASECSFTKMQQNPVKEINYMTSSQFFGYQLYKNAYFLLNYSFYLSFCITV